MIPIAIDASVAGSSDLNSGYPVDSAAPGEAIWSGTCNCTQNSATIVIPAAQAIWNPNCTTYDNVDPEVGHVLYVDHNVADASNNGCHYEITAVSGTWGVTDFTITAHKALPNVAGATGTFAYRIGGTKASIGSAISRRLLANNIGGSGASVGDASARGWRIQFGVGHDETLSATLNVNLVASATLGTCMIGTASFANATSLSPATRIATLRFNTAGTNGIAETGSATNQAFDIYGLRLVREGSSGGAALTRVYKGMADGLIIEANATATAKWQDGYVKNGSAFTGDLLNSTVSDCTRAGVRNTAGNGLLCVNVVATRCGSNTTGENGGFAQGVQNTHSHMLLNCRAVSCSTAIDMPCNNTGDNRASTAGARQHRTLTVAGFEAINCTIPIVNRNTTAHHGGNSVLLIGVYESGMPVANEFVALTDATGSALTAAYLHDTGYRVVAPVYSPGASIDSAIFFASPNAGKPGPLVRRLRNTLPYQMFPSNAQQGVPTPGETTGRER